jgi:NhaA family Na+:H+ antiporter
MTQGQKYQRSLVSRMFAHEAAGGVVLILAAVAALLVANSPLDASYQVALQSPLSITLGGSGLTKPLILWINETTG